MQKEIRVPEITRVIKTATPVNTVMMTEADGRNVPCDGTVAANEDLITGTLQAATYENDKPATVRQRSQTGTNLGIASGAISDLTVPLTLTADGKFEAGGAGIECAMPEATAADGEFVEFRWL